MAGAPARRRGTWCPPSPPRHCPRRQHQRREAPLRRPPVPSRPPPRRAPDLWLVAWVRRPGGTDLAWACGAAQRGRPRRRHRGWMMGVLRLARHWWTPGRWWRLHCRPFPPLRMATRRGRLALPLTGAARTGIGVPHRSRRRRSNLQQLCPKSFLRSRPASGTGSLIRQLSWLPRRAMTRHPPLRVMFSPRPCLRFHPTPACLPRTGLLLTPGTATGILIRPLRGQIRFPWEHHPSGLLTSLARSWWWRTRW